MNGPGLAMTASFDPGIGSGLAGCQMSFTANDQATFPWVSARVQSVSGTTATLRVKVLNGADGAITSDYQTLAVDISGGQLAIEVVFDEDKPVATNDQRCSWTLTANGQSAGGTLPRDLSSGILRAAVYGYDGLAGVSYDPPQITRWPSADLGVTGAPPIHYFALYPPTGGNLVRMARTGAEFVIRRDGLAEPFTPSQRRPLCTVYRRNSPLEEWAATATRPTAGIATAGPWWPLLLALDPWLFAFTGGYSVPGCHVSDDEGATWTWADDYFDEHFGDLSDYDPRQTLNQHRNELDVVYLAALLDSRDWLGAVFAYGYDGNDEQLLVRATGESAEVLVDPAREVTDDGCRPCPQVWRRSDGTWVVGWLAGDDWAQVSSEFASLDTALFGLWTQEAGEVIWGAGSGDMSVVALHTGREGAQVLAGYHGELQRFIALYRPNDTGIWSGPYLNLDQPLAAMPYVTQRGDGTWEIGWLIDGTWTRYTAGDPTGVWEVVS